MPSLCLVIKITVLIRDGSSEVMSALIGVSFAGRWGPPARLHAERPYLIVLSALAIRLPSSIQ